MEEEEWIDGMVEEWGVIFPNIPIFQFSSIPISPCVIVKNKIYYLKKSLIITKCLLLIP
jgi:hypothetical protein